VSVAALVNETEGSLRGAGGHTKRDGVKAILAELMQAGYITRSDKPKHNPDGSFAGYDYIVSEESAPSQDKPSTVAPSPDEPSTVEPSPPNPTQVITDSKKELKKAATTDDRAPRADAVQVASHLACPVERLVAAYHEALPDNPRVKILNDARRKMIAARWKEAARLECKPFGYRTAEEGLKAWRAFFDVCADSDFLTGKAKAQPGKPPFIASIDFLFSPAGFANCIENKYHREVA
jgi:hypothetical protein